MLRLFVLCIAVAPALAYAGTAIDPAMIGVWTGRAEFVAIDPEDDLPVPAAHSVEQLSLRIEPTFVASGRSARNGCVLLGKAVPQVNATTDRSVKLTIALSNCSDEILSRSYIGTLGFNQQASVFVLRLAAADKAGVSYAINGVMERSQ